MQQGNPTLSAIRLAALAHGEPLISLLFHPELVLGSTDKNVLDIEAPGFVMLEGTK